MTKLAILALAALLIFAALFAVLPDRSPTSAQLHAEHLAQQQADALQPLDTTVAAIWRVLPLVLAVAVFAYLAAWGMAALDRFRDRTAFELPDGAGRLPVLRSDQATATASLAAFHQVNALQAQRELPNQTYAPHITYSPSHTHNPNLRYDYRGAGDTIAAPESESAVVPALPTLASLLDAGRVGKHNPLVLGYDVSDGSEVSGSWLDLYSTVIGGLPGTGKTTSQRFLACQTALHGAKFVIVDPQANAGDESLAGTLAPLRSAFLCEPASSDAAILSAVRFISSIGEARINRRDRDTTPIILWIDETTKLLGRSAIGGELARLLEAVAQEYRKSAVFVCASGQIWTASRATSELRDSFASVLCHRMKRSQARMLVPTDESALVERLSVGQAMLWRTSGTTQTIAIPNTSAADVQRVGQIIAGYQQATTASAQAHNRQPAGSLLEAYRNQATTAPASRSPEAAQAVALFLAGSDLPAIVHQLRGVKSNQGRRYQVAAAEVQQLLRDGLK